ncbi:MAG: FimB/Mfa2 family fimbrial subunit [Bacteroidales bacterium]|nr:FimB/Mfa2 family fimbrial subunit [Bacteroidales bacterium]
MTNKILHIFYLMAMVSICALGSSCTKEDMSACPGQIRVYFTYAPNTINTSDVNRMHLYVFSGEGTYLGEYIDDRISNFGPDYYIDCSDLTPGTYRFIAWAGKDKQYYETIPGSFVKGQTTYDQALLKLKHSGDVVSTLIPHIFHAQLSNATVVLQKVQRFEMPLTQLSNTIHLRTVGLPADENRYAFTIEDNNCAYKFDRSRTMSSLCNRFAYTASCTKDEFSQLNATLNVLELSAERRTPRLHILNKTTGTTLYPVGAQSGDLIGLILSAYPQNNFETTHTYDILLAFSGNAVTGYRVSITINGWQVRHENGELID